MGVRRNDHRGIKCATYAEIQGTPKIRGQGRENLSKVGRELIVYRTTREGSSPEGWVWRQGAKDRGWRTSKNHKELYPG